jgi:hypothetical protein
MEKTEPLGNFDFLDTSSENASEDMILDYLAQIIADIYMSEIDNDIQKNTEPEQQSLF